MVGRMSWLRFAGAGTIMAAAERHANPYRDPGQALSCRFGDGGDWDTYRDVTAGPLELPAGVSTITMRVKSLQGIAPCNLAKLRLLPTE